MQKDLVPGTDYYIYQDDELFKYTTDSLLLTSLARPKGNVIDIGSGSGIISIRCIDKKGVKRFVNIEINRHAHEVSQESLKLNGLDRRVESYNIDVSDVKSYFRNQEFDSVIMNPPYFTKSLKNYKKTKEIARHSDSIIEFIQASRYLLKNGGKLFIVFPAKRLIDLIYILRNEGLEPKKLRFVKNDRDKEAYLVYIEAVKEGKPELKILPDMILFETGTRNLTEEAEKIYRNEEI